MAQLPEVTLPLPVLMGIVATRAMLGVGIGLLLADKLGARRRPLGAALVTVGAITTIPAVMALMQARRSPELPAATGTAADTSALPSSLPTT
jgi:hypothetical protein